MTSPGRVVSFIVGAAGGLAGGWLIFGRHPPAPGSVPAPAPATVTVTAAVPDAPPQATEPVALHRRAPTLSLPMPGASPHPDSGSETEELQQLRGRVAQLENKLALEAKATVAKEGSPIKPPDHLDPRFESERLRLALNGAIKEAGLDGEVTAIDCEEYPCLAIGEMKGESFGPEEAGKVAEALAKAGYAGDSKQSFGSTVEENGVRRNLFGAAVFPKTEGDDRAQIDKRLRTRFNQSQGLE